MNDPRARWTKHVIVNMKKIICQIEDFHVPEDHIMKLNESEKLDKNMDLASKLKKLWNMKVSVIPIIVGILGTHSENLEVDFRRIETVQHS